MCIAGTHGDEARKFQVLLSKAHTSRGIEYLYSNHGIYSLPVSRFTEASDLAVNSVSVGASNALRGCHGYSAHRSDVLPGIGIGTGSNLVSTQNPSFRVQSKFILKLSRFNLYSTDLQRHQLV